MKIEQVRLVNYRGHRDLTVNFSSQFNVLVGVNGSGKTSLLAAIAQSFFGLTSYMPQVVSQQWADDSVRVERFETGGRVRFERQYPTSIEARGTFLDQSIAWALERPSEASTTLISGTPPGVLWQQETACAKQPGEVNTQAVLPVLALYRADRQWQDSQQGVLAAATQQPGRQDAYAHYADARCSRGRSQSALSAFKRRRRQARPLTKSTTTS